MNNLILLGLSFWSASAFAFHKVNCGAQNHEPSLSASFLSDAMFGAIVNASIQYGDQVATYQFKEGHYLTAQNNVIFIAFPTGETLIVDRSEQNAVAFDKKGIFLGTLTCNPSVR